MRDWLESIAGPAYATAMMWTLGALLLLLVVLLLIKIVRNLTFGTFVSGGRNRKARLAVMDAAAVDSHRRLVLVRRDDVEHLILIGGPTDVVVEQNIRLAQTLRRPDEPAREHTHEERPRAMPPVAVPPPQPVRDAAPFQASREASARSVPEPASARPVPEPASARPVPEPAVARFPVVSQPAPAPRPAPPPAATVPPRQPVAAPAYRPPSPAVTVVPPPPVAERPAVQPPPVTDAQEDLIPDLDAALREELESTLEERKPRREGDLPESVEDEMSKLLGDLSRNKR